MIVFLSIMAISPITVCSIFLMKRRYTCSLHFFELPPCIRIILFCIGNCISVNKRIIQKRNCIPEGSCCGVCIFQIGHSCTVSWTVWKCFCQLMLFTINSYKSVIHKSCNATIFPDTDFLPVRQISTHKQSFQK